MIELWMSLKENMNCGSKLTDVACWPEKQNNKKESTSAPGTHNLDKKRFHHTGDLFREALFRPNHPRTRFYELSIGEPSRNIIEMIFQKAKIDPSRPPKKIKRVLRVKNSVETIERFEKYREKVMKKAYELKDKHPRSMVDGNELLLFYGTTMACCRRKSKQVSELCKDPTCRVCRVIHSKFEMELSRRNGIQLSANSEELSDSMVALKMKNTVRATIVCRAVAGRIANTADGVFDEYDSIGREGPHSNLEYLIVRNPSAVLPCFVIVFT